MMKNNSPRFIADCMLGTLAKHLRIRGYDTLYFNTIDDGEIVKRAISEDRIILTRDTRLVERREVQRYVLINSDNLEEQIEKVAKEMNLTPDRKKYFTRCLICNSLLSSIEKNRVREMVPPHVFRTHDSFVYCRQCDKIYWPGTHIDHFLDQIKGE